MKFIGDIAKDGEVKAIASGAISAAGKPLIVNSDGTVTFPTATAVNITEAKGAFAEVRSGHGFPYGKGGATFDSNSNRVVFTFRDPSNNHFGTAIVCTVASDNTISYGTPQVYSSVTATNVNRCCFDSSNNRILIAFVLSSDDDGRVIVGSVDPSNNTISFGTAVKFDGTNNCTTVYNCFDSTNNKVILTWSRSQKGKAVVGTIDSSDNSISFGSIVEFSADLSEPRPVHDVNANKIVIQYQDGENSNRGTAKVGTVSGTSISFGSAVVYSTTNLYGSQAIGVYDSTNNKTVFIYHDANDGEKGKARVVSISGTTPSFGTEATFESQKAATLTAVFDSNVGKVAIGYYDETPTNMRHITGTVSGTNISFGSELDITGDQAQPAPDNSAFDSNVGKVVYFARNITQSDKPYAVVVQVGGSTTVATPLTTENFIGFSDGVYATGQKVTVKSTGSIVSISSLTAGQEYFVQTDGTLGTTAATPSVSAGTAIGSNKLIVKG